MAEVIYGVKGFTKEKNAKERFLGKTTTLGCGYQMGFIKFQATCDSYGIDLGEKTDYIEREDKEGKVTRIYYAPLAKRAVETFRAANPAVVDFWYEIQRCVERCIRDGKPVEHRGLLITRERDFMYIRLLSGRRLAYYRPGIDNDGIYFYGMDSQTHQFGKKRLYGGKIAEQCTQATARDLLAHGILNIEKAGYPVVMTVHDETISEVDKGEAKKHLENINEIMCDIPAWAKGCPVKAEGFVCDRYRKG
jgi:DNA polymerase